jgi:uncharacterized membrane protein
MESKAPVPEPMNLTRQPRRLARQTLSPLSTLTLVAALGTVLMGVLAFIRILLVDGVAVLPILILAMPVLLSALAVAVRWRWVAALTRKLAAVVERLASA